jgi:hypothetical protein
MKKETGKVGMKAIVVVLASVIVFLAIIQGCRVLFHASDEN